MAIIITDYFPQKNNEEERQKLIKECELLEKQIKEARKWKEENKWALGIIQDMPEMIK